MDDIFLSVKFFRTFLWSYIQDLIQTNCSFSEWLINSYSFCKWHGCILNDFLFKLETQPPERDRDLSMLIMAVTIESKTGQDAYIAGWNEVKYTKTDQMLA